MRHSMFGQAKADPNLTPMLDVVFQLMTFFIMVMNFSQDAFDERIRLPVAGSARPVEGSKAELDRLVLNIDREGNLLLGGQQYDTEGAKREIVTQARLLRLGLAAIGTPVSPGDALPTTLVIRADRDTAYGQLYDIIRACQSNGFLKFALKAEMGEGG